MKIRALILTFVIMMLIAPAQTQSVELEASFETFYNDQNIGTSSLTLEDVVPGDNGGWLIEVRTNTTSDIYLMLNQTSEAENGCTEPEKIAEAGDCGITGELGDKLEFRVWKDDGTFQESDDSEKVDLENSWILLNSRDGFPGLFESDQTYYVGVKWDLPADTGNNVQTDSLQYDLVVLSEYSESQSLETTSTSSSGGSGSSSNSGGSNRITVVSTQEVRSSSDSSIEQGRLNITVRNSTGVVEGVRINTESKNTSFSLEKVSFTDSKGQVIQNLPEGRYRVNLTKDGYISVQLRDVTVNGSATTYKSVQLSEKENILEKEESVNETVDRTEDQSFARTPTAEFTGQTTDFLGVSVLLVLILVALIYYLKDR